MVKNIQRKSFSPLGLPFPKQLYACLCNEGYVQIVFQVILKAILSL